MSPDLVRLRNQRCRERQRDRQINDDVVTEGETQQRMVRELRGKERGQPCDRGADEACARKRGEPGPEDREREARRHLVGAERQGEHGKQERSAQPGESRDDVAQGREPARRRRDEASDRTDQHHAFDAEIEDTAFLRDELAEAGEQDRRRRDDERHDDRDRDVEAHEVRCTGAGTRRTRLMTNMSTASRKNSIIA